jgi:hypothetical protein
MADALQCLGSLKLMLRAHRMETMEKMAKGLEKDATHHELVGRCKEAQWMIDQIGDQINSLTGGKDGSTEEL